MKGSKRIVVPFHAGKVLHPKIVKQVLKAIEEIIELIPLGLMYVVEQLKQEVINLAGVR